MSLKRAVVAAAALLMLAGCGTGSKATDRPGCLLVQTRYSAMVEVMERWQYGNAPTTDMLDALEDLKSGADHQDAAAKTAEFKTVSAAMGQATQSVYRAVNSGTGFEPAAHALADASRELNALCKQWA